MDVGKQYRCAKAYFLLSKLAHHYGITIDRAIGAPGYGKDIVDAMNAIDKMFIASCMCLIGTLKADDKERLMSAESMTRDLVGQGGETKSLAEKCARLCSAPSRSQL